MMFCLLGTLSAEVCFEQTYGGKTKDDETAEPLKACLRQRWMGGQTARREDRYWCRFKRYMLQ